MTTVKMKCVGGPFNNSKMQINYEDWIVGDLIKLTDTERGTGLYIFKGDHLEFVKDA